VVVLVCWNVQSLVDDLVASLPFLVFQFDVIGAIVIIVVACFADGGNWRPLIGLMEMFFSRTF